MKIYKNIFLLIICFFLATNMSFAFFTPKDYKKSFLQNALDAEKRHNDKSAFFIYEKSMFYYKNDKTVMEAYAGFCERRKYYDKAIPLYQKLYNLTKDEYYLYKKYSIELKNPKLPSAYLKKIIEDNRLSLAHKKQFNNDLIKQFFVKKDFANTKKYCDQINKKDLTEETARACSVATEAISGDKDAYAFYQRYLELSPKNTDIIKKLLKTAETKADYQTQEKLLKKFVEVNPKDNGIKYRLAGFYEKHHQYAKAAKIYAQLIASGDKSKHVADSYSYALKAAKGGDKGVYISQSYAPAPLTAQQKKEMQLYNALDNKDFKKAQIYIEELLKKYPQNPKYIQLRLDVAMAQDDFATALTYFNKIHKTEALTEEETKQLAFLYSKTDSLDKALSLIEGLLAKKPENTDLNDLARNYSMAQKNWDKAIFYTEKLLVQKPTDENLLKDRGDFYSIKKDYAKAIKSYKTLIANYPNAEYKLSLADLYMANKEFSQAENLLEEIYQQDPNDKKVVKSYLNALVAQEKLDKAVAIVQKHRLQYTKDGAIIYGDAHMKNKNYHAAKQNYLRAVNADKKDVLAKNKLAQSYRMLKETQNAALVYNNILAKDPENKDAKLGLGYLAIDQRQYVMARNRFREILAKNPDYKPAKVGIANSYVANGDDFQALHELRQVNPDDETSLIKGKTYYKMGMLSDAKKVLEGVVTADAEELKHQIKKDEVITITPNYTLFRQTLAQEFKLNYNKVGVNVTQGIDKNMKIFADYNMYNYASGYMYAVEGNDVRSYSNLTNEVRLGVMGRPVAKNEFRADIGAKIFQFNQGYMLNTDTWIKHYFNDKFAMKLGFWRNNLEQTYLSAVGTYVNNRLTGQVADNRSYLEYEYRLPKRYYAFGRTSYGVMKGLNIPTNPYMEQMLGVGRLLYNDPDNKLVNKINLDFVSYNSGYRYNLLNIYDDANPRHSYGGYFSPRYFTANTLNVKFEKKSKKFSYTLKAFGGGQSSITPTKSTTTWGIAPGISYEFNDNVSMNLLYSYFNYSDMQRNIFMFNVVIRGLKKRAKG